VTGEPWLGDACSLVEAFRDGTLHPAEVLDACLSAIEGSGYRELTEGQRVQFESVAGQKGPQAKSVRPV